MSLLTAYISYYSYGTVSRQLVFFFFNDTATTEIYTLSLHDALPIFRFGFDGDRNHGLGERDRLEHDRVRLVAQRVTSRSRSDRKSTRLNSSHLVISYAVFCLKKKKNAIIDILTYTNIFDLCVVELVV